MLRKSQVSAPIELVIAIIILVSSIVIALSVLNNVQETQCSHELRTEVQKLQLAMQDLALQSPPSTRVVQFRMPSCGGVNVDAVRFVYYSDPLYCRACPGQLGGCWKVDLVMYSYPKDVGGIGSYSASPEVLKKASVCVDIAGDMRLFDEHSQGNAECQELSTNPCPFNTPAGESITSCDFEVSGVPTSVWKEGAGDENPSQWVTLGKESRADKNFKVRLKKSVYTSEIGESGAIMICAQSCDAEGVDC